MRLWVIVLGGMIVKWLIIFFKDLVFLGSEVMNLVVGGVKLVNVFFCWDWMFCGSKKFGRLLSKDKKVEL